MFAALNHEAREAADRYGKSAKIFSQKILFADLSLIGVGFASFMVNSETS
jgi:hypothetical protein